MTPLPSQLVHYSSRQISMDALFDRHPDGILSSLVGKPLGFYLSIEDNGRGWLDYISTLSSDWKRKLIFRYRVTLKPDVRLLALDSPGAVEQLEVQYGPVRNAPGYAPNWNQLRADGFQGFIVPAYRKWFSDSMWWRTIDADCICLFDTSAIESMEIQPWTDAERERHGIPRVELDVAPFTRDEILALDREHAVPRFDAMAPEMKAAMEQLANLDADFREKRKKLAE